MAASMLRSRLLTGGRASSMRETPAGPAGSTCTRSPLLRTDVVLTARTAGATRRVTVRSKLEHWRAMVTGSGWRESGKDRRGAAAAKGGQTKLQ